MIELKGKPVADDIKEKAMKRVEELRSQGVIPKIEMHQDMNTFPSGGCVHS